MGSDGAQIRKTAVKNYLQSMEC